MKWHYGLTLDEWDALLVAQGGACAICGTTEPGKRRWATDHDHETGHVRGILCHRCNLCIGWLGENAAQVAERSEKIAKYLSAPSPVPTARAHPKLMLNHYRKAA